jgi:RHS repeat-associated protein
MSAALAPKKPRQGVRLRIPRKSTRAQLASAHRLRGNRRLKLRLASGERLPGQYFDSETGLHYNYKRDYAPELGRYWQSDPIGLIGGLNNYSYAGGNALRFTDVFGLRACCSPSTKTDAECCASPPATEALQGRSGTPICCEGRLVPCIKTRSSPEPIYSIIRSCVLRHEQKHIDEDVLGCECTGIYPARPKEGRYDIGECEAYWIEIRCLKEGSAKCGTDELCRSWIRQHMELKLSQRELYQCNP